MTNYVGYEILPFRERYVPPALGLVLNFACTVYLRVSYNSHFVYLSVLSRGDFFFFARKKLNFYNCIVQCLQTSVFKDLNFVIGKFATFIVLRTEQCQLRVA